MSIDRDGIAARLRGLLGEGEDLELGSLAQRLGVGEAPLRRSMDALAPYPTVEVLAAVIRLYGIDPTWLITGKYDAHTHRSVMEGTVDPAAALRPFFERAVRVSKPTREGFRSDDRK